VRVAALNFGAIGGEFTLSFKAFKERVWVRWFKIVPTARLK